MIQTLHGILLADCLMHCWMLKQEGNLFCIEKKTQQLCLLPTLIFFKCFTEWQSKCFFWLALKGKVVSVIPNRAISCTLSPYARNLEVELCFLHSMPQRCCRQLLWLKKSTTCSHCSLDNIQSISWFNFIQPVQINQEPVKIFPCTYFYH